MLDLLKDFLAEHQPRVIGAALLAFAVWCIGGFWLALAVPAAIAGVILLLS